MSSTTTSVSSADNNRRLQITSSSIARWQKSSGTTLASKVYLSHQQTALGYAQDTNDTSKTLQHHATAVLLEHLEP